MSQLTEPERKSVAVIGLGYVGSCVAATLADRGAVVVGIDTDGALVDALNQSCCRFQEQELEELLARAVGSGRLSCTTDYAAVAGVDVVLLIVGTPVRDDGSLDDRQLRAACTTLAKHLREGQLVVLKSTVPLGSTRSLVRPLLEESGLTAGEDFQLAFSPERLAEGTALAELRTLPVVAGGIDAASTKAAEGFWRQALGVEVLAMSTLEAAECVKLADNWWIDLNIALGNELAKFCALFDVDVLEVIKAANTVPKGTGSVNILLPSVGVGGSCLTKDPWMVWRSARDRDLDIRTAAVGREVNARMPGYTAQLIFDELAKLGKKPESARIAVLGLAFKNNTGDLRATPTKGAVDALIEAGAAVRVHDPLADDTSVKEMFGIRPSNSVAEAVRDADCVAILAHHRAFEAIDYGSLPVAKSCVVLDGRAYFPAEKIESLRALGFVYRGIGR
ncbi:nucleotide sugar dehydrogenase [Amycolatopsis circi]|uniref:nucleotide sugar dehydrogenase n=1 Tax=Amycolatopsis circi TaxID=871959 RepID=UPI000E286099|nr:nucleotide sugar dehydrogenase [Amycolatopsis circi]